MKLFIRIKNMLHRLQNRKGATMIEYAILAVLISVVAFALIRGIGGWVSTAFSSVSNTLNT